MSPEPGALYPADEHVRNFYSAFQQPSPPDGSGLKVKVQPAGYGERPWLCSAGPSDRTGQGERGGNQESGQGKCPRKRDGAQPEATAARQPRAWPSQSSGSNPLPLGRANRLQGASPAERTGLSLPLSRRPLAPILTRPERRAPPGRPLPARTARLDEQTLLTSFSPL